MIKHGTIRLSDLCDLVATQVDPADLGDTLYVGLEHIGSGLFVRQGAGRAADVRSTKYAFQPGDVLYSKLRPYLDKAVVVTEAGICSTELLVLRPRPGIDPCFVVSVLHAPTFIEHAVAGMTGVQHPRTSWAHIREFELPAFQPEEQASIGRLLWAVQAAISWNEAAVEATAALKRAALHTLFTRGLRGEAQKETEIGPVPESWDVVQLGSLGRIGNGSTPKKTVPDYWAGGTIPWLTSAKVYDGEIVEAEQFVTERALAECHLPRLRPGAVLVAITGQGKTLGHCAVLGIEATISQHLAYIAVSREKADPFFVRGYIETRYPYLRQIAAGGGSTKGALTCAFLRRMHVPLPSLDEQREIVAILNAIDRKIELHRRKRAALAELFKALLHKLITGEVRVADLDLSVLAQPTRMEVVA